MASPEAALERAAPERGPWLVVVPDATRALDLPAALRALHARLGPGSEVLVGLGLHRKSTPEELAPLRAATPWPVHDHAVDEVVALGRVGGIPLLVDRRVAAARRILAVGIVELHQYAGFSGGQKGVVVGCAGRGTLAALHRRELVRDPRVEVGRLDDNPFREAVEALGERLGTVELALQALPDGRWVAGDPVGAVRAAAAAQRVFVEVDGAWAAALLRVPAAKAINAYQASRAATYLALSPAPPLSEGARLVVDAACPEGIGRGAGERAFGGLLASCPPPWSTLLSGPAAQGAGLQRAWMIARLAERYELVFAGCERPEELRACGLEATALPADEVAGPGALVVPEPFKRLPQRPSPGANCPGSRARRS